MRRKIYIKKERQMSNSKGENLLNYKYYFFQVFYLVMEVERGREDGAGKQNL